MEQKVRELISDIISEKLNRVIEEMSNEEFIDEVCTKIESNYPIDTEENREEIKGMVGDQVLPFLKKMGEYFVETFNQNK